MNNSKTINFNVAKRLIIIFLICLSSLLILNISSGSMFKKSVIRYYDCSLKEAKKYADFSLFIPAYLSKGLRLKKILRSEGDKKLQVGIKFEGLNKELDIIQFKSLSRRMTNDDELKKQIDINRNKAEITNLEKDRIMIEWNIEQTHIILISNVDYGEVLKIAESMKMIEE